VSGTTARDDIAQSPPMARRGVPDTNVELMASAAGPNTDASDELDMLLPMLPPPRIFREV